MNSFNDSFDYSNLVLATPTIGLLEVLRVFSFTLLTFKLVDVFEDLIYVCLPNIDLVEVDEVAYVYYLVY